MAGDPPARSVMTRVDELGGAGARWNGAESSEPPVAGSPTLLSVLWRDAETAMVVIDRDRQIRHVNPVATRALHHFGLSVGNVLPKLGHEVSRADNGQVLARRDWPVERPANGSSSRSEPAEPIALDDGVVGALMIWHDATDGREFAERNRSEQTRLGQLLEGASDYAIIMLDPRGRVCSWSPAAQRLQGFSSHEAIGLPYANFFDQGERAAGVPEQNLREAAIHGKTQTEGKRVRGDGSVFWAHAGLTAMRDEKGQLLGYVKVTHDVSERRASERAVVELNELLEERIAQQTVQLTHQAADLAAVNAELEAFSYSVSHDLRAPLRAMSGYARIMEEELGERLPEQVTHCVGRVIENAKQMGSLIDALLAFSRMQRQSMHSAPIDMTQLVRECWTALTPARGDRRIEFTLEQLPVATGDRQLIQQVWLNLLDNAIKFTGQQDTARVQVRTELAAGGPVTYLVQDDGAGFDMRYADKIGQVFQRLHHAEDFAGIGIGMALVQRIVQRHGGRMTALGEPGVGATFGFSLRDEPTMGTA